MIKTVLMVFSSLKSKTGVKKSALYIIAFIVTLAFVLYFKSVFIERDKLVQTVDSLKTSIETMTITVETLEKKEAVETVIYVERDAREQVFRDELKKMQASLKSDLHLIKEQYDDDDENYDRASSERIITGLWDHYCNTVHCPE